MSHTLKNLMLILVSLVLFGVAYVVLTRNSNTGESGLGLVGEEDSITIRTNQILSDTKKIDGYKLDVSLFKDERFVSLKDTHVHIPDVYTGRPNPFKSVE